MQDKDFISKQLITYIGNKRSLLGFIDDSLQDILPSLSTKPSFLDGFAGSGVVGRFFKRYASKVIVNDMEPYSALMAKCYMSNSGDVDIKAVTEANVALNAANNGVKGVISKMYAPQDDQDIKMGERVFYTTRNAEIIDSIRAGIDIFPEGIKPYLLAPLIYRASVHTNTSGVFKGFYKSKETGLGQLGGSAGDALKRIGQDIVLDIPIFSEFNCETEVFNQDTNTLVSDIEVDVAYFDPPYNQHPYGSNYFMLNVILSNTEPTATSKVSGIPTDWNKSSYNYKHSAAEAFSTLIERTNAKYIVVSYNDGGILTLDELRAIFERYGTVNVAQKAYVKMRSARPSETTVTPDKMQETLFIIKKG